MADFLIALSALSNITLGILVYRQKPRERPARLFFIFTLSAALWITTNLLWKIFLTFQWLSLTYSSGILFAFMGVLWPYMLVKKTYPRFFLLYLISTALFILTFVNNMIVKEFHGRFSGDYSQLQTGPFFPVYALYMLWVLGWSLYCLWGGYKSEQKLKRKQITYVFLGGAIFDAIVIISDFIVPGIFNNFTFAFIDSPSSLILIGLTAYATLKYRLMGVEVFIKRSFIYAAIGLFSYAAFHLVAGTLIHFFSTLLSLQSLIASFFIAVIFALFLPRVEKFCVYVANKYLYANIYNARDTFQKSTSAIVAMVKLHEITGSIIHTIQATFGVSRIAFIITQKQFSIVKHRGFSKAHIQIFEKNAPLFTQVQKIFLAEKTEYSKGDTQYNQTIIKMLRAFFKKTGVEIIVPLFIKAKSLAIILIGHKEGKRSYTEEDIKLLDTLAKQGTIALHNALLYQDLQEKNERLRQLIVAQKKFLDIASHQLRTPLSIIRGASSMALSHEEAVLPREKAIPMIHEASIRMSGVVSRLLLASKLDAVGFTIDRKNLQPVLLLPLVQNLLHSLLLKFPRHRIAITVEINEDIRVYADPGYLEIALENLIENAITYTSPKQGGAISVTSRLEEDFIRISIRDTGIGIPGKEKKEIFQKFYRASNAKQLIPDGTGLGLFIVKKIMEAHPEGRSGMESREGQGSEFWIAFKKI